MDGEPQAVCVTVDTEGEWRTCRDQNFSGLSEHIAARTADDAFPSATSVTSIGSTARTISCEPAGMVRRNAALSNGRGLPGARGTPRQQHDNGEGQYFAIVHSNKRSTTVAIAGDCRHNRRRMKILMAASEAHPYAKTGGLADVVGALPFSLKARGEEVAVALPLYPSATPYTRTAERVYDRLLVSMGDTVWECAVKRIIDRDVSFYFIDCPELYDRSSLRRRGQRLPR